MILEQVEAVVRDGTGTGGTVDQVQWVHRRFQRFWWHAVIVEIVEIHATWIIVVANIWVLVMVIVVVEMELEKGWRGCGTDCCCCGGGWLWMGHAACSGVQFDNVGGGGDGDQNLWLVSGEIMKMQAKLAWSLCWRRSCGWWMWLSV